jgi:hypothetical protein
VLRLGGTGNTRWASASTNSCQVPVTPRVITRSPACTPLTPSPTLATVPNRAGGAWVAYDAKAWTCVAVPAAKVRIAVENHGKKLAVWTLDAAQRCQSGVFDVVGPGFYQSMDAPCARRSHPGAITH